MSTNVQLGATYKISELSTKLFGEGMKAVAEYVNANVDEIGKYCLSKDVVEVRTTSRLTLHLCLKYSGQQLLSTFVTFR